jgi:hypothetical protein
MELSPSQQFELEQMRRASQRMSREQALDLLIQAKRLLAIKTNVYLQLLHDYHQQGQPTGNPAPSPRD